MHYATPLDWGLTTIAYNVDKVRQILGPNAPTDRLAMRRHGPYLLHAGARDIYKSTDG